MLLRPDCLERAATGWLFNLMPARTHLTKLDDTEDVNTIDSRRHCRPEEAR